MNIDQVLEYLMTNLCFLNSSNINTILQDSIQSNASHASQGISGFCLFDTSQS